MSSLISFFFLSSCAIFKKEEGQVSVRLGTGEHRGSGCEGDGPVQTAGPCRASGSAGHVVHVCVRVSECERGRRVSTRATYVCGFEGQTSAVTRRPLLHGPCTSETCPPGRALQACRSAPGLGEQASVLTARVGEQSVPWALTQASEAHARRLPLKRALCPELHPDTL